MKYKKIGDILILDNNSSQEDYESLSKKHNVKTIMKIDHIEGTKREPVFKILYGNDTQTINKENGCLFKLDLAKVMWSKGNNNERLRIAKLVEDDETVLDMFAGIGYFSIPIGVHSNAEKIISIEINPNSYNFLCENAKLNKLDNLIPVLGDCMVETPKFKADRIVMGYVKTTHHYLNVAINSLNKGGIMPIERIKNESGNRDVELLNLTKIKKYSPGVWHVVVDARIN